MEEILQAIMTPAVKTVLTVIILFIALLYLISIVWVIRDARMRGTNYIIWGVISLVPFVGPLAYLLLRPPLYAADREEQEYDMRIKQRELSLNADCPICGYPAEPDFLLCPHCGTQLRNQCPHCGHALNPDWVACPYCCTRVSGAASSPARFSRRQQHAFTEDYGDADVTMIQDDDRTMD